MKTIDLVKQVMSAGKDVFGDVPERQVATMVNAVLAELNRQIREGSGQVVLAGFGRFVIRETKVSIEGSETTRRRVGFRPAAPRVEAKPAAKSRKPARKKG